VRDYDEALAFYVGKLGFSLIEDTYQPAQDKRWVVVSPPGATESALLLARASTEHQATRVGDQTGGRVFLFLYTDDFWRDFNAYKSKGIKVIREPKTPRSHQITIRTTLSERTLTGSACRRPSRSARSSWPS
jgi:catechol 2,3-dioxygenase-like lactoylglutathione lyase family enzyme